MNERSCVDLAVTLMEQPSHRVDRLVRTVKEQEEAVNLKQGCLGPP